MIDLLTQAALGSMFSIMESGRWLVPRAVFKTVDPVASPGGGFDSHPLRQLYQTRHGPGGRARLGNVVRLAYAAATLTIATR